MKTKLLFIAVAAVIAMITGCGDPQKENTNIAPPAPSVITNQIGSATLQSPFTQRQEGMFDGIGREQLQTQPGQTNLPFPQSRYWHTRIEFLKVDGSSLDPASVTMPMNVSRVRITLVNDATAAAPVQYLAEGSVYVMSTKGYAIANAPAGIPLRVWNPSNPMAPLFELKFGNNFGGTGPMLGLQWSSFRGSLFGGTILLEDATGKHIIQY